MEQICIWNPMTTRFIKQTLIYHQYGTSVAESQTFLHTKRPSGAMSREKRLPFAG